MTDIMSLPAEMLSNIISFLDNIDPPSVQHLYELPSNAIFHSDNTALKNLSLTCHRLRELTRAPLFAYMLFDMKNIEEPLSFVRTYGLMDSIKSVVLHNKDLSPGDKPILDYPPVWKALTTTPDSINPPVINIAMQPAYVIRMITKQGKFQDFGCMLPECFQLLRLEQSKSSASVRRKAISDSSNPPSDAFQLRAWTHCTLNQHWRKYDHRRTPIYRRTSGPTLNRMRLDTRSSYSLTSFDIVGALAGHYMDMITSFLNTYPNLRLLRTKFETRPTVRRELHLVNNNPYANHLAQMTLGRWYEMITRWIWLYSPLTTFFAMDYEIKPMRDVFDTALFGLMGWEHSGEGTWVKKWSWFVSKR